MKLSNKKKVIGTVSMAVSNLISDQVETDSGFLQTQSLPTRF